MTPRRPPMSARAGVAALAMVAAAAVLAGVLTGVGPARSKAPTWRAEALQPPAPLFTRTVPAANKPSLTLVVDADKVLGWIGGDESYTGREAAVRLGDRTETVLVQADNTFTWHYRVDKPTAATFQVGKLKQRATLSPPQTLSPSAFFVVDRTVYRPGHALRFAGFLRDCARGGQFTAVRGRKVQVVLRSRGKKHVAAKLDLASDDFGRITGSYTFTGADALDEYTLSIEGFRGEAVVRLAEFRKAKVRLAILPKRERRALRLRFEARDFLDKPVPAERVQFTATVLHRAAADKARALNAGQFVYRRELPTWLPDPDELTDEQRFRLCHEGVWPQTGETVVAQVRQQIALGGEPCGEYELPLEEAWLDGRCAVRVEGVLVDQNGREQRSARLIPLAASEPNAKRKLAIKLGKRRFRTDEPIDVTVRVTGPNGGAALPPRNTSAVVLRRTHGPVSAYYPWRYRSAASIYASHALPQAAYRARYSIARSAGRVRPDWLYYRPIRQAAGEMVAAAAVLDGKASFKLAQPGSYQLVVVSHLADGRTLRESVDCAVIPAETEPGLVLDLDAADYRPGDVLAGEVHSRFRDARVLLTLRDSKGVRLWRAIKLAGAVARFRQRVPEGLAYGCSLVAQYVDRDARVHTAHRSLRVRPADRLLEIKTATEPTYQPGQKVKLAVEVNRNEPVDLVVSVYDKSLLGIARNRAPDIGSFYFADERAFEESTWDVLARRLGERTVQDLCRAACAEQKAGKLPPSPQRQLLVSCWAGGYVNIHHLAALLNHAGVSARPVTSASQWYRRFAKTDEAADRLVDVLRHQQNSWRITCTFYDDVLVLAEAHPSRQTVPYYNPWGYGALLDGTRRAARADAAYSVSGNAFRSLSGQSFISHLPASWSLAESLLGPDADTAHIAIRRDFSDSAFWNAHVRTDARGRAAVEFKLPDSLTNWQVVVTGVSQRMHVGQATHSFRTYKPIMVWPMIPRVFTQRDKVRLFARVHNRTDKAQTIRVKLKVRNGRVLDRDAADVTVRAKDSACVYWTFQPDRPGYTQLLMTAECGAGSDASLKRLPVVPACAVEQVITASGFCKDEAVVEVPKEALGLSKMEITLVPSLAADMVDTLDYLVQYPHGCVEQTMSRFLPAVRVAGILKKLGIRHEPLETKLPRCVDRGIKRLLQLQRKDGGWGWNGNGRTHEMMTPYALYGLLEAERAGYKLGAEQAVEKGLARLRQFINAMGEKAAADRIYCLYVYTLRKPMRDEWWRFIEGHSKKHRLSDYALALALEMAVRHEKADLARGLAKQLRARVRKGGHGVNWTTAGFSRWGNNPHEITAAVFKALVALDPDDPLIADILSYFAATKRGNRWNSTKDTAMVLFAMCDYLARKDFEIGKGTKVAVRVNGGKGVEVDLGKGLVKKITVPADQVRFGRNVVSFAGSSAGAMYRLVVHYQRTGETVPAFASGLRVSRRVVLLDKNGKSVREVRPGQTVPRGSYLLSEVTARMVSGAGMSYVLVESPKPSCAEIVPVDDKRFPQSSTRYVLREDKTAGVLYHHERTGSGLVDRCVFHAELAGEYTMAPAYVELMYKTEIRGHSGTFRLHVAEDPKAVQ